MQRKPASKKKKKRMPKGNKGIERAKKSLEGLEPNAQKLVQRANARDIVSMARRSCEKALKVLTDIMSDPEADPRARIMAAKEVITRGYGQAPRHVVHTMAAGLAKDELEQAAMIILRRRLESAHDSPAKLKVVPK